MPWIKTIPFAASGGKLRSLYARIAGPEGAVDNIMMMHSLRPHSMEGHMALYKAVLHHAGNRVPKWVLEMLGVYVSHLNGCDYCLEHHFAGLTRLLGDAAQAQALRDALEAGDIAGAPLERREKAALRYAERLTRDPAEMREMEVEALRLAGWEDGEILEINQVVAYFAYANRTVLGLGCSTAGEVLGLSPGNSDDPEDWGHR
jgi:uncharacterized peroxidase-related enzyme